MRYYFDTEFIEDGKTIDLISIGIVCEDERTFYAINSECDLTRANEWVKENVLPYISARQKQFSLFTRKEIKNKLLEFIGEDREPEFVAYYASYDWVVLCQLFGSMMDLPPYFPKFCIDLKQEMDRLSIDKIPFSNDNIHHALEDALWCKKAWEWVTS